MIKKMKTGLTVGKFAPFHKGHHFLMESAYKQVDHMVVIIYDAPNQTDIPLNVRANWLRKLYPEAMIIEGWDVPIDLGWSEAIQQKHEQFILSLLDGVSIDAFFSSESYGLRMSQVLNCKNIIVDIDRSAIAISGTDIRNDVFSLRSYLEPIVYKDLITTVAILGAPKTGKTELTVALAEAYHTVYVPDYEAYYRENYKKTGPLDESEYVLIAEKQLEIQEAMFQDAHKYLFVDTCALLTGIHSKQNHSRINMPLEIQLCDINWGYDLIFVNASPQDRYHHRIIGELKMRKMPYFILSGSVQTRIHQVKSILSRYRKFMNPMDLNVKGD